jgi:hypothetical protein
MEMAELADLEHFYASFNSLSTPAGSTQPLADRFCVRNATKLYSLILRANNFTGTVNMSHCEGLGLLDVQVCCVVLQLPFVLELLPLCCTRSEAFWQMPACNCLSMRTAKHSCMWCLEL